MSSFTLAVLTLVAAAADRPTKFEDVATVTAVFEPATAKPGQVVTLKLTIAPKPKCWTYPANAPEGQIGKNAFRFPAAGDVRFRETFDDPKAGLKTKAGPTGGVELYYPGETTWELKGIVSPAAKPGKITVALDKSKLEACNDDNCFYTDPKKPPTAQLEVLAGPAEQVPAEWQDVLNPPARSAESKALPDKQSSNTPGVVRKPLTAAPVYAEQLLKVEQSLTRDGGKKAVERTAGGLWAFLATAAAWGWISLLTPCVFPMIPITVSLFLKQGQQSTRKAVQLSLVYSLTIILVLGLSAVALLSVFQKLSVDPFMNIALGALFVAFALSLFGLFDIALPGFLLRAAEKRRGAGGLFGTVFGAVAFSIVSFTCVAPFLGGFAGLAASGQYADWELVLAGLAFSTAFASPFFVLALFPSLLKKLPRSGGWLDTVKVVMGFLELAAALKFFRTAELRLLAKPEYFTYDLVLAGWVAVAAVSALYLLGTFRLPHDEEKSHVGVGRLVFALLFGGLGVYLAPGLWKQPDGKGQRPGGVVFAWVDSFLLPDATAELPWQADLPAALDAARAEKKRVFLDFTGKTCTNCKLNEANVFPTPAVDPLLRQYNLVQLYTDEVPAEFFSAATTTGQREAEANANVAFQERAFGTRQLPLYVILEPTATGVRVVGVYDEGKINDAAAFGAFLKKGLE